MSSASAHLDWEALDRARLGEASAEERAHLEACAPCRAELEEVERVAASLKRAARAPIAVPADREAAILGAARARAGAIRSGKLRRLPFWRRARPLAMAASLVLGASAVWLAFRQEAMNLPPRSSSGRANLEAAPPRADAPHVEAAKHEKQTVEPKSIHPGDERRALEFQAADKPAAAPMIEGELGNLKDLGSKQTTPSDDLVGAKAEPAKESPDRVPRERLLFDQGPARLAPPPVEPGSIRELPAGVREEESAARSMERDGARDGGFAGAANRGASGALSTVTAAKPSGPAPAVAPPAPALPGLGSAAEPPRDESAAAAHAGDDAAELSKKAVSPRTVFTVELGAGRALARMEVRDGAEIRQQGTELRWSRSTNQLVIPRELTARAVEGFELLAPPGRTIRAVTSTSHGIEARPLDPARWLVRSTGALDGAPREIRLHVELDAP